MEVFFAGKIIEVNGGFATSMFVAVGNSPHGQNV